MNTIDDVCDWKKVRQENLQGHGTSFPPEIAVKCDNCTGKRDEGCYVNYLSERKQLNYFGAGTEE